MKSVLLMAALTLCWFSAPVPAQTAEPPADQPGARQNDRNRDNRRDRRRRPADDRGRWERYRNATPEERQKMRTERMVDITARTYELNDEQKDLVRAEMDKMRDERRAQMGPDADRYDQLRDRMYEFWRSRRRDRDGNGDEDRRSMGQDPEFQKIRTEMREIERKYPFDWQASMQRIEALLPPEQAAKGHAKLEERRQRWQQRRQDREDEMQNMLVEAMRESDKAMAEGRAQSALDVLNRAERQLNRRGLSEDVRNQLRARIQQAKQQIEPAVKQEQANATPPAEHPWDKFVREFNERYGLTATQQASSAAILKDVRSRAAQIEVANAAKIAAAAEITDAKAREAKLKELNAPIDKLFEELKIRLDGLLTAEQRAKTPSA